MASYNRVNGDYACYSEPLLRDILKEEWKFTGFVISDWFAKGLTLASPPAGLDVEMPFSSGLFPEIFDSEYFYGPQLTSAVNGNLVNLEHIDEAAFRILHQKVKFGLIDHPVVFEPGRTQSTANQLLALEAARKGMVLLQNGPQRALDDDVLPLDAATMSKVAVVAFTPISRTRVTRAAVTPKSRIPSYSSPRSRAFAITSARRPSPTKRSRATRATSKMQTPSSSSRLIGRRTSSALPRARKASGKTARAWTSCLAISKTSRAQSCSRTPTGA